MATNGFQIPNLALVGDGFDVEAFRAKYVCVGVGCNSVGQHRAAHGKVLCEACDRVATSAEVGRVRVNWWALSGGALCALTVLAEIALVAWVLSW